MPAYALFLEVSAQVPVSVVGHVYGALFAWVSTVLEFCCPNHQELIILAEQIPRLYKDAPREALLPVLAYAVKFDSLEYHIVLPLLKLDELTQFNVFNDQAIPVTPVEAIRASMQAVSTVVLFEIKGPVIGEPAPRDIFESEVAI